MAVFGRSSFGKEIKGSGGLHCMSNSPKSDGPIKIILDTHLGPDYDDVWAIAMLHALEKLGM